jgi:hypothetical protein
MTTISLTVLILLAVATLAAYARHDRFAGSASVTHPFDDLGLVDERQHLVPRA